MERPLRVLDCFGTIVFAGAGRPNHVRMAARFAAALNCDVTVAKSFVYPLVAHAWLAQTPSMDVAAQVRATAAALVVPESLLLDFLWSEVGPGASEWVVPHATRVALEALVDDGFELRLLTNTALTPAQLDRALDDLRIRALFTTVLASSAGEGKKPELAWFRRAFAGGGDDVAMVGDHETFDLAPARALGIPTVQIRSAADWVNPPRLLRRRA